MSNDGSQNPKTDLRPRLALLQGADEGKLDGLTCPQCGQPCVSVWFTHPAEELYRTWFVCSQCNFEMRAQNVGRPPHYSAERDRTARAPAPSEFQGGKVRVELVRELRALAGRGADVPELVELLQRRLELDDENSVLPVLLYFRTAFDVTLREALPLREWLGGRDRTEIDSLLIPAMARTKSRWRAQEALPT